jgi:ribose/xylose/arabinose/galactoside ABC-type transport system permease subunit
LVKENEKKSQKALATRERISLFLIENSIWVILSVIYVSFAVIQPAFRSPSFFFTLFYFSVPIGFIILAEAVCLITGVFDISVGQMTGFITMLSAKIILSLDFFQVIPGYLLVFLPLLFGIALGMLNGFLVGKIKLNPFLATLGMFLVFLGAKLETSGATTLFGLPEGYLIFGGEIIPTLILFVIVVIFLYILLTKTSFGCHIYGLGGNAEASEMLGVNKAKIYFLVYTISGLLCGFAALTYTGFVSAASPTVASDTVFMAFAGAILAGVSIHGGRGSIVNVIGGILLISIIEGGLTMVQMSVYTRQIIFGALVIVAIIVNRTRERLRDRILLPR